MRTRTVLPIIAAWLIGLATFWSAATLSGGLYTHRLWTDIECRMIQRDGLDFEPGAEIVPGQANPCYHRYARFHLP